MNSGAADLYGNDGVESPNGRLERLEILVLVGKDSETPVVDAQTDTGMHVLFRRLKPRVPLRLRRNRSERRFKASMRKR